MNLKVGNILICNKEFQCQEISSFVCNIGDEVTILKEYVTDTSECYYVRCSSGMGTWMYVTRNKNTRKSVGSILEHFYTKISRAKRIIDEYKSM